MSDAIHTKLSAARTRLIIDKPFLGALVLRLPLEQADPSWCNTTATDARKIYFNAHYIEQLSLEQTQFVLAHEALHCALSHFARRQHREKHRWDVACDYAVNPLLLADGLTPPPGILADDGFANMTAEEIYPSIEDNCHEQPLDQHVYDESGQGSQQNSGHMAQGKTQGKETPGSQGKDRGNDVNAKETQAKEQGLKGNSKQQNPGSGETNAKAAGAAKPRPLNHTERENLKVQWQQRLAGAAQQAMQAGKLGGAMARLVDHLLEPQLPWRNLLAHYVTSVARDDYSYSRPSTRRGDPALYPSLRSSQINVLVVLDTSGSIGDVEMQEFLTEVDAIKSQIRARITLHACDAQLAPDGPWVYEPWEPFQLPRRFEGGGGTAFKPLFQWLQQQEQDPDLVLYFTDANAEFPQQEPRIPVLWLVKGRGKVPWGRRIQLN
ncbi:MAG: VWA-like domain-containing protein [Gammaproteobacteria bacterium]|nr:VWA-like domain-containing protein [Gammaproteobacteria bacterium]MDH5803067.1 VWA-like domain-containing protein [Gammaproteobacteria bacterium]